MYIFDAVPDEIWRYCWDLVPRNDLKNLSCVCHHFQPICQSLLFREFPISISRVVKDAPFTSDSNMAIIKEKIEALQGVMSNQLLVGSVRRLYISTIYLEISLSGTDHLLVQTDSGESPLSLFLSAMLVSLPHFSKTKALILHWPNILSGSLLNRVLKVAAGCLPLIEALTSDMESVPSMTNSHP